MASTAGEPASSRRGARSSTTRRDARPFIYLALDQLAAAAYAYLLIAAIPNRHLGAALHLWSLPVLAQLMAVGMATRLFRHPAVRRAGWWLAVLAGSALLLVTVALIARVVISAAFLAGVYGALGQAAALLALVGVALVIELVALLPLFQVKFLLGRAGRRAYLRA